jgi:hypothetical protein
VSVCCCDRGPFPLGHRKRACGRKTEVCPVANRVTCEWCLGAEENCSRATAEGQTSKHQNIVTTDTASSQQELPTEVLFTQASDHQHMVSDISGTCLLCRRHEHASTLLGACLSRRGTIIASRPIQCLRSMRPIGLSDYQTPHISESTCVAIIFTQSRGVSCHVSLFFSFRFRVHITVAGHTDMSSHK